MYIVQVEAQVLLSVSVPGGQWEEEHGWAIPKHGWAIPKHGWATPKHGWATPKHGWATLKHGWATSTLGLASPKQSWATPKHGWATRLLYEEVGSLSKWFFLGKKVYEAKLNIYLNNLRKGAHFDRLPNLS